MSRQALSCSEKSHDREAATGIGRTGAGSAALTANRAAPPQSRGAVQRLGAAMANGAGCAVLRRPTAKRPWHMRAYPGPSRRQQLRGRVARYGRLSDDGRHGVVGAVNDCSTLRAQRSPLVPSAGVVGRGSRSRWVCDPRHLIAESRQ